MRAQQSGRERAFIVMRVLGSLVFMRFGLMRLMCIRFAVVCIERLRIAVRARIAAEQIPLQAFLQLAESRNARMRMLIRHAPTGAPSTAASTAPRDGPLPCRPRQSTPKLPSERHTPADSLTLQEA